MPMKKRGDERGVRLWKLIEMYQKLYDIPTSAMPARLGMSRSTFYARKKDPGKLTLEELDTIKRMLKIPREEILNALMAA